MIKEEVFIVITRMEQEKKKREKKKSIHVACQVTVFFPFSIQLSLKFFKQVLKKLLACFTSTHWFSP